MFLTLNTLIATILLSSTFAFAPTEILILISSQDNSYHRQLGARLRNDIINQSQALPPDSIINVRMLHEIFNHHPGQWTVANVLPLLLGDGDFRGGGGAVLNEHTKWIIWCEESTHIVLSALLEALSQENHTQPLYFGHALYDHEATIIHHFAFFENPQWFPYPLLRSGVVFSSALLKSISAAIASGGGDQQRRTDFSIDAAHELARFIYDNVPVRVGVGAGQQRHPDSNAARRDGKRLGIANGSRQRRLPHDAYNADDTTSGQGRGALKNLQKVIFRKVPYVCPLALGAYESIKATASVSARVRTTAAATKTTGTRCAMYALPADASACLPIRRENIYFAIKTCQKFHKERIPIIKATWAPFAKHLRYYSDVADRDIPTSSTGVANVEMGHCAKTLAILKLALEHIEQLNRPTAAERAIRWLFLSDDDTLLSIAGVCQILGCYNHTAEIYLGERYGYRLHATDGFNYITGGGGIALSLPTVKRILQHCTCPTAAAPDDMILGSCLHAIQVSAIHSARFHQARPSDYAPELLAIEPAISFHKFWQLDPLAVYEKYFGAADRQLLHKETLHTPQRLKVQSSTNVSRRPVKVRTNCAADITKAFNAAECIARSPFPLLQHADEKHFEL